MVLIAWYECFNCKISILSKYCFCPITVKLILKMALAQLDSCQFICFKIEFHKLNQLVYHTYIWTCSSPWSVLLAQWKRWVYGWLALHIEYKPCKCSLMVKTDRGAEGKRGTINQHLSKLPHLVWSDASSASQR